MITAVAFYDVITWVHIVAVVIGFGPTFAYALFAGVAAKQGLRASLAVEQGILKWNMNGTTYGLVVIFLTGVYMAADGPWEFSDFFVSWGFVAVLALFGVVHGYFLPRERRLIAGLEEEADAAGGDTKVRRSARLVTLDREIGRMGIVSGVFIILTIYVMTAKPFL